MRERVITSRNNAAVQRARQVRDGKVRKEIFVEGLRLCEEAVLAGLRIVEAIATARVSEDERGKLLLEELNHSGVRVSLITDEVMSFISATKASQGVILIAERPQSGEQILEENQRDVPLIVIIHEMNNPSNAGAILRTGEAAGATGLIATAGTTYLFSPKALRGAMGSTFRVPLWIGADFARVLAWCNERAIRIVATSSLARKTHTEMDWTEPCAIIIGPEAAGLTDEEMMVADEVVRIPMCDPVESLNAAVACGVILYEAARQRLLL